MYSYKESKELKKNITDSREGEKTAYVELCNLKMEMYIYFLVTNKMVILTHLYNTVGAVGE